MARSKRFPLVGVVSLGCSKNLADTESVLGGLGAGGWGLVPIQERADRLPINTCAFIGPAVEESHGAIAEAALEGQARHESRGRRRLHGQPFRRRVRGALPSDGTVH